MYEAEPSVSHFDRGNPSVRVRVLQGHPKALDKERDSEERKWWQPAAKDLSKQLQGSSERE